MQAGLVRASQLPTPGSVSTPHRIGTVLHGDPRPLVSGAIVQVSGPAAVTVAVRLVERMLSVTAHPAAWVGDPVIQPFPPDLGTAGIDLRRLLVVRLSDRTARLQAMDRLLRSRICRILVLDLSGDLDAGTLPDPGVLGRFMHMCERARTAVVLSAPAAVAALSPAVRVHLRCRHGGAVEDEPPAADGSDSTGVRIDVLRSRGRLEGGRLDGRFEPGLC